MSRRTTVTPQQLMLTLEKWPTQRVFEEVREELIKALADLLLEALGQESNERSVTTGGGDESED